MDIVKELVRKVPRNMLLCFISSVAAGIIIHLYILTHKLPNWDDINNLRGFGSGAEYGRWLLEYIRPLYGEWSVPAFNGMLAILLWSIGAAMIYKALELTTQTSAVLLGIMVISFPAIASTMTYMFTVTCYAIGFLLVCIGSMLFRRYKYGFLPAILLYLLSLGIYQSYICLAVSILIMGFVLDLIRDGKRFKEVFMDGCKAVAALVITLVSYLAVSKWFNHSITTDRGLDTMGQIDVLELPRLMMRSYKRISEYFLWKPYSFTTPFTQRVNIAVCIMIVLIFVWILIRSNRYRDKLESILATVLMLVLPMAIASIYILAPETQDATLMMLHPYFFVYVILISLAETLGMQIKNAGGDNKEGSRYDQRTQVSKYMIGISVILIAVIGYRNYLVANEAYFRTEIAFERAYAYYNRIMMNVEAKSGYRYGDAVAIIGEFYPEPTPLSSYNIDDDRFTEFSGIALENGLLTSGSRRNFLRTYLGIDLPEVSDEEIDVIKESEEYQAMPTYPDSTSIQKINQVWVVKVHE